MESANRKPAKSHSIVSKFAKICKFRSTSFFFSSSPSHRHTTSDGEKNKSGNGGALDHLRVENGRDATDDSQCDPEKVNLQPHSDVKCHDIDSRQDTDIGKVFETVSALKLAYIQLQKAHIPHNPDKIRAADECIVREIENLCKIKREFKENWFSRNIKSKSVGFVAQIHSYRKSLEKLQSLMKDKECEIIRLSRQLQELDTRNDKLVQKLRQLNKDNNTEEGGVVENANRVAVSVKSFEEMAADVSRAIHDFSKPLISLMKASGWDLDSAASFIQSSVSYSKRSHKKFAFEAYIARRMFHGFSAQSCDDNASSSSVDNVLRFEDPINALDEDPGSSFAEFCRSKYLLVVHPTMEASFFGNLDHRDLVSKGKHPRTSFYRLFLKMAKGVWVLQGMAGAIEPKALMFGVKRGTEFCGAYMESVVGDYAESGQEQCALEVEFMVMPGFRIGSAVVRSRVYVSCSSKPRNDIIGSNGCS